MKIELKQIADFIIGQFSMRHISFTQNQPDELLVFNDDYWLGRVFKPGEFHNDSISTRYEGSICLPDFLSKEITEVGEPVSLENRIMHIDVSPKRDVAAFAFCADRGQRGIALAEIIDETEGALAKEKVKALKVIAKYLDIGLDSFDARVSLCPNAPYLVYTSARGGSFIVLKYSIGKGKRESPQLFRVARPTPENNGCKHVEISYDGKLIASEEYGDLHSARVSRVLNVYRLNTNADGTHTLEKPRRLNVNLGYDIVGAIAFSCDSKYLALGTDYRMTRTQVRKEAKVRIYHIEDTKDERLTKVAETEIGAVAKIEDMAFSQDNKLAVAYTPYYSITPTLCHVKVLQMNGA